MSNGCDRSVMLSPHVGAEREKARVWKLLLMGWCAAVGG